MTLDRALYFIDLKRYKEAQAEIMKVLSVEPHNAEAFAILAFCNLELGRRDDALKHAKKAIALNPASAYAHEIMSHVCVVRSDYRGAEAAANEAIRLEPERSRGYSLLALTLRCEARWVEALSAAEQGLRIDPIDLNCLTARAEALSILGRAEESLDAARKLVMSHPEHPHSHSYAGWVVLRMGHNDKAAEHFREALRLDPQFSWAREGLIEALRARSWVYSWIIPTQTWRLRWGRPLGILLPVAVIASMFVLNFLTGGRAGIFFWAMAIGTLGLALVLLAWLATPLLNLMISAHPYGRLALTREEKSEAHMFGLLVPSVAIAFFVAWWTNSGYAWNGFVIGLVATILATVLTKVENAPRKWIAVCLCGYIGAAVALILAAVGLWA